MSGPLRVWTRSVTGARASRSPANHPQIHSMLWNHTTEYSTAEIPLACGVSVQNEADIM